MNNQRDIVFLERDQHGIYQVVLASAAGIILEPPTFAIWTLLVWRFVAGAGLYFRAVVANKMPGGC